MVNLDPNLDYIPDLIKAEKQRAVDLDWDGQTDRADLVWIKVRRLQANIDAGVLYEPKF